MADLLLAAAREAMGPERAALADSLSDDARLLWVCGSLLYGVDQWQQPLARAYGCNPRTMRRWAAGRSQVPARLLAWLAQRLEHHSAATGRAFGMLTDYLRRSGATEGAKNG